MFSPNRPKKLAFSAKKHVLWGLEFYFTSKIKWKLTCACHQLWLSRTLDQSYFVDSRFKNITVFPFFQKSLRVRSFESMTFTRFLCWYRLIQWEKLCENREKRCGIVGFSTNFTYVSGLSPFLNRTTAACGSVLQCAFFVNVFHVLRSCQVVVTFV